VPAIIEKFEGVLDALESPPIIMVTRGGAHADPLDHGYGAGAG
jgi:hypothetical protein